MAQAAWCWAKGRSCCARMSGDASATGVYARLRNERCAGARAAYNVGGRKESGAKERKEPSAAAAVKERLVERVPCPQSELVGLVYEERRPRCFWRAGGDGAGPVEKLRLPPVQPVGSF